MQVSKFKNQLIMKNTIYSFLLFTLMVGIINSCSDQDAIDIGLKPRDLSFGWSQHSFPFTIETITSFSKNRNLLNLQVDDTVTVNFKVTNSSHLYDSTYYKMAILVDNLDYHQQIGIDYDFIFQGKKYVNNADSLILHNGDNIGKIIIKKPGGFQLHYIAVDYIPTHGYGKGNNQYDASLNFNAVRIVAYRYEQQIRDGNIWHHSEWNYYHKVWVDTGDKQNDNFFNGFKASASVGDLTTDTDNITKGISFDIYPSQYYEGGDSPKTFGTLKKITISNIVNGLPFSAVYDNIPISFQGRHDDWSEIGKNNW